MDMCFWSVETIYKRGLCLDSLIPSQGLLVFVCVAAKFLAAYRFSFRLRLSPPQCVCMCMKMRFAFSISDGFFLFLASSALHQLLVLYAPPTFRPPAQSHFAALAIDLRKRRRRRVGKAYLCFIIGERVCTRVWLCVLCDRNVESHCARTATRMSTYIFFAYGAHRIALCLVNWVAAHVIALVLLSCLRNIRPDTHTYECTFGMFASQRHWSVYSVYQAMWFRCLLAAARECALGELHFKRDSICIFVGHLL